MIVSEGLNWFCATNKKVKVFKEKQNSEVNYQTKREPTFSNCGLVRAFDFKCGEVIEDRRESDQDKEFPFPPTIKDIRSYKCKKPTPFMG